MRMLHATVEFVLWTMQAWITDPQFARLKGPTLGLRVSRQKPGL